MTDVSTMKLNFVCLCKHAWLCPHNILRLIVLWEAFVLPFKPTTDFACSAIEMLAQQGSM